MKSYKYRLDLPNGSGVTRATAQCFRAGERTTNNDCIISEKAVSVSYNGISHAVMMLTPVNLEEFAIGFSLTEGVIDKVVDIYDIKLIEHNTGLELELTISTAQFAQLKSTRRAIAGVSGCGICGKESLAHLQVQVSKVSSDCELNTQALLKAQNEFKSHQPLQRQTGGIHGAAWCTQNGEIIALFEDIGRHNAVDKLIGHMLMNELSTNQGFMMVSSRISYEIVQKAMRANITLIVGVSAVSSMAIELAKQSGIQLVGFAREQRYSLYS